MTLSKEVTVRGGCLLDMTYYPFDSQTCHLSFGSWTRGIETLDLTLASDNITTSYVYARSSGAIFAEPQFKTIKLLLPGTIDLMCISAKRETLHENYAGGQVS